MLRISTVWTRSLRSWRRLLVSGSGQEFTQVVERVNALNVLQAVAANSWHNMGFRQKLWLLCACAALVLLWRQFCPTGCIGERWPGMVWLAYSEGVLLYTIHVQRLLHQSARLT